MSKAIAGRGRLARVVLTSRAAAATKKYSGGSGSSDDIEVGDFMGNLDGELKDYHIMTVISNNKDTGEIVCASTNAGCTITISYEQFLNDKGSKGETKYKASDSSNYYHIQKVINEWHDANPNYTVEEVTRYVTQNKNEDGSINLKALNEIVSAMENEINGGTKVTLNNENGNKTTKT